MEAAGRREGVKETWRAQGQRYGVSDGRCGEAGDRAACRLDGGAGRETGGDLWSRREARGKDSVIVVQNRSAGAGGWGGYR